jgi:WD40 repeat protein
MKVWNSEKGVEIAELKEHTHGLLSIEFGTSGRMLASAGEDRNIKIWQCSDWCLLFTLKYVFICTKKEQIIRKNE